MSLVLVTGGAGFIGSHLVTSLVERGDAVRVLDDLSTGKIENLHHVMDRITFIRGSIADEATCQEACAGVRYVWHLAALGSVPRSVADPLASHAVNSTGTLKLLWAAKQLGVERVVYSSSSSVYGKYAILPQRPDAVLRPASPYAVTKLAGEHYLRVFYECYGLETVALRYFNVFGPRQDPFSPYAAVIPAFFRALLNGQPARIEGDGQQSRDFTFVADCVQATIKAMTASNAQGKVYNVACGRETTVADLYNMVAELLQLQQPPRYVEARAGDVPHSLADISLTMSDLGYRPEYTLRSGLEQSIRWYHEVLAQKSR